MTEQLSSKLKVKNLTVYENELYESNCTDCDKLQLNYLTDLIIDTLIIS